VFAAVCVLLFAAAAMGSGPVPAFHDHERNAGAPDGPRRSTINSFQLERLDAYFSGRAAASLDTLRMIVLRVQFQDVSMGDQPSWSAFPCACDSTWFDNELKHLRSYFDGASRDRMNTAWTLDGYVLTLPEDMIYYGDDRYEDTRVVELARAVVDSFDTAIDFSLYDHLFIIHPGPGQETDIFGDSPGQIWSSFYDRGDIDAAYPDTSVAGIITGDTLDGEPFHVDNFSIVPAVSSQDFADVGTLGIWAFEVGNRVGLLPMFDSTPAGAIDSQGIGNFDVMAYGLFNVNGFVPAFPCAFNRVLAGWVDPVTIDATTAGQALTLDDINTGADADTLCIKVPITENEYYLIVNRVHDADFDSVFTFGDVDTNLVPENHDDLDGAEFDFFLTDLTNPFVRGTHPLYGPGTLLRYAGTGVYVWHVDEAVIREAVNQGYLPNDFVDRKGVDLEEADGVQDLDGPGPAGFALGSHWDSYRAGDNNQTSFTPDTRPATNANSGVPTGIIVEGISVPGADMQLVLRRDAGYDETRTRFDAASHGQPATAVNFDGAGDMEIVMLADTAGVYVFGPDGLEWVDGDGDPNTIEPYISVPGVFWSGPAAFADLDGGGDMELVASSTDGTVYAWKSDGSELYDPFGPGLIFPWQPMVAPPTIVDIADAGGVDITAIAVVGAWSGTVEARFFDADGLPVVPEDPFSAIATAPGHASVPMALVTASDEEGTFDGLVFTAIDTVSGTVTIELWPVRAATPRQTRPVGWKRTFSVTPGLSPGEVRPSAPAAGDLDGDGDDDVVFTWPAGRVDILDGSTGSVQSAQLRASMPSSPSLGDLDSDGTLEIALWDTEYLYLLASNGRDLTNWPRPLVTDGFADLPEPTVRRGYESPVIADVDGDGRVDAVYPVDDGGLYALRADGTPVPGFPRVAASSPATPSLADLDGSGELSLIAAGTVSELRRVDSVVDTFKTVEVTAMVIQTLAGSNAAGESYWLQYMGDLARTGATGSTHTRPSTTASYDESSFMVYPNPVKGEAVHARLMLNASATVRAHVYNLEGQEMFAQTYTANAGGAVATPFDEVIDVSALKSGLYFMRLYIETSAGTESLIKPFAIRR